MTRSRRPWTGLLVLLAALPLAGCSNASTRTRIRQLDAHEKELRASVTTLEAKQTALRQEIQRSEAAAAKARCLSEKESYRAVVAMTFAEYSVKVAEHKGCEAQSAKDGGMLAAAGCGVAAFLTGGLALAVCGGALVAGAAIGTSCSDGPPAMTAEDIRRKAQQVTGHPREPACDGTTTLAMGPGSTSARPASGSTWGGMTGTEVAPNREPQRIIGLGNSGLLQAPAAVPTPKERRKMYRKVKRARRKAEKQAARDRRKRR